MNMTTYFILQLIESSSADDRKGRQRDAGADQPRVKEIQHHPTGTVGIGSLFQKLSRQIFQIRSNGNCITPAVCHMSHSMVKYLISAAESCEQGFSEETLCRLCVTKRRSHKVGSSLPDYTGMLLSK